MPSPQIAPFGTWQSKITADSVVAGSLRLGHVALEGEDVWWSESRPDERGRGVLMRWRRGSAPVEVTPAPYNVRTRVHEYGGGEFVVQGDTAWFSNFADQRLYRADEAGIRPITPDAPLRYADAVADAGRQRLICVREDHSGQGEAESTIASVPWDGGEQQVLVRGSDFYACPRLSPDGHRLAWLGWRHPNMPWDGCELWLADVAPDGTLAQARLVAGGEDESIYQPEWAPDGRLYFVSDRTGFWNLYRLGAAGIEPIWPSHREFGQPAWQFGSATYGFVGDRTLFCTSDGGVDRFALVDTDSLAATPLPLPYQSARTVKCGRDRAVIIAGAPDQSSALLDVDVFTGRVEPIRATSRASVDAAWLSTPIPMEFATTDGGTAHCYLYEPRNPDYRAPDGERPPAIVKCHGGPTSSTATTLRMEIQYWTSRGFSVIDVDYRGSTGYGREYRNALRDKWGIYDVDDCVRAALAVAETGKADPARLCISGGSAGGYTVLSALTFRDVFAVGASYYGVSDLEGLAIDTHKFESRYLDRLVGPYPERRDIYQARSPLRHSARLRKPVIFFQGLEDKVVPPSQAEQMVEALRGNGVTVAYYPFEGEQHGFRSADNQRTCLIAELAFYGRVLGFEPAPEAISDR